MYKKDLYWCHSCLAPSIYEFGIDDHICPCCNKSNRMRYCETYVYDDNDKEVDVYVDKEREYHDPFEHINDNLPKCPTCHSLKIHKISGLDRAISVGFWGMASGKIGKTMECRDCGYKW